MPLSPVGELELVYLCSKCCRVNTGENGKQSQFAKW